MSEHYVDKTSCLEALPPEWPSDLMPEICDRVRKSRAKVVVLDDDPTGTQTVHGIPVLTGWDVPGLTRELKNPEKAFFILTNSRSLTTPDACRLGQELGKNLKAASEAAGIPVSIISRSDSTLRGHFPQEVDEVSTVMGDYGLPYIVCPFFQEGGRFTINDIHYVDEKNKLVPAARTAYAKDATFGFSNSNLCKWIEEKTKGRISAGDVTCITLSDIRQQGPDRVTEKLMTVPEGSACIVNAVSYRDMEVFMLGLLKARSAGKRFLYRTAASFVRVRAGVIPRSELISGSDLVSDTKTGGLFVVGSYVPKTTAQVKALIRQTDICPVEMDVSRILDPDTRDRVVKGAADQVNLALAAGKDTVVYTSRDLVRSDDPVKSLEIGQQVSASLIHVVRNIARPPRYLVAKGGITSSDVATKGLFVRRAMIMGQALPGVPVWQLGPESAYPGMHYIVFPGNVGEDEALVEVQERLSRELPGASC